MYLSSEQHQQPSRGSFIVSLASLFDSLERSFTNETFTSYFMQMSLIYACTGLDGSTILLTTAGEAIKPSIADLVFQAA